MNTKKLIERADLQLEKVKEQLEGDRGRLKGLKEIRGNELANELLESRPDHKQKIAELDKEIDVLEFNIESSPLIIDGLKRARLKLLSQKEKEEKDQALREQTKIEITLNETSSKLIPLLKEVSKLNSALKSNWSEWDKLDTISGKGLTDTKVLRPSEQMLDRVCETFLDEWLGRSSETRRYYSKDKFRETKIIF